MNDFKLFVLYYYSGYKYNNFSKKRLFFEFFYLASFQ